MNYKHRRILKLADRVARVRPSRFCFSHWVGDDWKGATDLSCGTTACALGWATTMPLFQRLGLRLSRRGGSTVRLGRYNAREDEGQTYIGRQIFGIDRSTFIRLFVPTVFGDSGRLEADVTPKEWAQHARKIVKELQEA